MSEKKCPQETVCSRGEIAQVRANWGSKRFLVVMQAGEEEKNEKVNELETIVNGLLKRRHPHHSSHVTLTPSS